MPFRHPLTHSLYRRRIWNLRVRAERGENVAGELAAAIAERDAYRCRDI
jgi:hypothetical protein